MVLSRRQLLASLALKQPVPMRAITKGPKHHWFGYYDKLQFDPSGRYVLGMQVDFEHRSPTPDDTIRVGMVDLEDGDRWIELGESRAWNWQQGCMLQWVPGSKTEVIWNDREGGRYVSRILDVKSGKKRTLPPGLRGRARTAAGRSPRFPPPERHAARLRLRGHCPIRISVAASRKTMPASGGGPEDRRRQLLVSFAAAARIPYPKGDSKGAKHWFNHLLVSPGRPRFIFLHRWRGRHQGQRWDTRMFTAVPTARTSTCSTRTAALRTSSGAIRATSWPGPWHPSHGNRFYLSKDKTEKVEVVGEGVMTVNGHCTYLPRQRVDPERHLPGQGAQPEPLPVPRGQPAAHPLGHFHTPKEYKGEWRCDLHPRYSPDGRKVVIDSVHGGNGRQMYLIDIRLANVEGFTFSATSGMAPKDAKKAFEKSRDLLKKKKLAEAQKELEKATSLYPKYAIAWYDLGRVYEAQNQVEPARKAFESSIEADPKYVNPYLNLSGIFAKEGNWEKTAEFTTKALKLNPFEYPTMYFYNAVANLNLEKLDEAEKSAREARKLDAKNRIPKIDHVLGIVLAQKRDLPGAKDSLSAYLKASPNAGDADQVKKQLEQIDKLIAEGQ
jgi:Tfp pilus assembly protein PilF